MNIMFVKNMYMTICVFYNFRMDIWYETYKLYRFISQAYPKGSLTLVSTMPSTVFNWHPSSITVSNHTA